MRTTSRCGGSQVVTGAPSGGAAPAGVSLPVGDHPAPGGGGAGRRAGGDLHPRREHPGRGGGGDGGPDVVRGGGQVDLAGDLELAAHDWVGSLAFVMVGCRATTNRCERPPGAASSWYLATRPLT